MSDDVKTELPEYIIQWLVLQTSCAVAVKTQKAAIVLRVKDKV